MLYCTILVWSEMPRCPAAKCQVLCAKCQAAMPIHAAIIIDYRYPYPYQHRTRTVRVPYGIGIPCRPQTPLRRWTSRALSGLVFRATRSFAVSSISRSEMNSVARCRSGSSGPQGEVRVKRYGDTEYSYGTKQYSDSTRTVRYSYSHTVSTPDSCHGIDIEVIRVRVQFLAIVHQFDAMYVLYCAVRARWRMEDGWADHYWSCSYSDLLVL